MDIKSISEKITFFQDWGPVVGLVVTLIWAVRNQVRNIQLKKSLTITTTATMVEFKLNYHKVESPAMVEAWATLSKHFRPVCIREADDSLTEVAFNENPRDARGWFYLIPKQVGLSQEYSFSGKGYYEETWFARQSIAVPMVFGFEVNSVKPVSKQRLRSGVKVPFRFTQIGLGARIPLDSYLEIRRNKMVLKKIEASFEGVVLAECDFTNATTFRLPS